MSRVESHLLMKPTGSFNGSMITGRIDISIFTFLQIAKNHSHCFSPCLYDEILNLLACVAIFVRFASFGQGYKATVLFFASSFLYQEALLLLLLLLYHAAGTSCASDKSTICIGAQRTAPGKFCSLNEA